MQLNYFPQGFSRYPQYPSSGGLTATVWSQLIRAAQDNDDKFKEIINSIKNTADVNKGIDISTLAASYPTVTDHTTYFQQALAEYPIVYIPANYIAYIGNVTIPSNRTVYAEGQVNHDPTHIENIYPQIKPVAGATTLFDVSGSHNIKLSGFLLNGLNFANLITNVAGDGISLYGLVLYKGVVGYGTLTGNSYTTSIFNVWSRNCTYTFANLQDTHIVGGAHIANRYVFYGDNSGCAFNRMISRLEWSQNSGFNVYLVNGSSNMFEIQSDSGGMGACYFENCSGIYVTGLVRRPSRNPDLTANPYQSAFYLKGVKDFVGHIYCRDADSDSGDNYFTPNYVFTFDGTGTNPNRNIYISGDFSGHRIKPFRFIGTHPENLMVNGVAYTTESSGVLPNDTPKNRDLGSAAYQDWKVITAGDRPLAVLNAADMNSTSDQKFKWQGNYTPRKYFVTAIKAWGATQNLTTAAGGIYTGATKTSVTVVDATQVYTTNTSAPIVNGLTLATYPASNYLTDTNLYLSLTTPQGTSAACNFAVFGYILE